MEPESTMKQVSPSGKPYDLEERSFRLTQDVIAFVNTCPKTLPNIEIMRQVVRSAGSIGANYIEAQEALSDKDFDMRVKICRKEAKESRYWLRLVEVRDDGNEHTRQALVGETDELLKTFASILEKRARRNQLRVSS